MADLIYVILVLHESKRLKLKNSASAN